MGLSLKDIRSMFPKDKPAFSPPFYAERNKHDEVHVYDAGDDCVMSFCTHTQIALDDNRGLEAEVSYWEAEARRIVSALNVAYLKGPSHD